MLSSLPTWVVDRVQEFTQDLYPFIKARKNLKGPLDTAPSGSRSTYSVNSMLQTPEEISENVQGFYAGLDADLRKKESERGEEKAIEATNRLEVPYVMECAEKCICELFYDRCVLSSLPSPYFTKWPSAASSSCQHPMTSLMMKHLHLE